MSDTNTDARTPAAPPPARKPTRPVGAPALPKELAAARERTAGEVTALLRLAELDAVLLDREEGGQAPVDDEGAKLRRRLTARLSPEVLEAYVRSLRAGRRPAVVRLVGSVCTGCHVRLHSKLDHQIRQRRGVAACPHCLRLVYDPAWLTS
ncbi:MAG TPA: hypothetical protein VMT70_15285 [Vicinamibacteria bacterium]|nr:hypothetical protein [Vicinamibacteria bacterium]